MYKDVYRTIRMSEKTVNMFVENVGEDDHAVLGESTAMAVPEYQGKCENRLWDGRVGR
jgi:hypothetical protein